MITENLIHWPLIVEELENTGFNAEFNGNAIVVSLTNRKPSKMEVEAALDNAFDGIKFEVKSTDKGVTVR